MLLLRYLGIDRPAKVKSNIQISFRSNSLLTLDRKSEDACKKMGGAKYEVEEDEFLRDSRAAKFMCDHLTFSKLLTSE